MPIINVQADGYVKDPSTASTVKVSPHVALIHKGPLVQVTVGVNNTIANQILQSGRALPSTVTGLALIDTGASSTCVDDAAAQNLGLPVIDVVQVASASHSSTPQNVYPVHIEIAGLSVGIDSPRSIGAPLSSQGILVLIGRDVLQHCMLVYNGKTGIFSLSI